MLQAAGRQGPESESYLCLKSSFQVLSEPGESACPAHSDSFCDGLFQLVLSKQVLLEKEENSRTYTKWPAHTTLKGS